MFSLSSLPHTDGTLSFKYRIKSTSTATNPSLWLRFRDKTSGQRLSVVCEKNRVLISQLYNGVTTTLASNTSWGTVLDTDYDVSMVAEGNRVEVWMALSGQPKQLVLTGTTDLLSGDRLIITSGTGAMVSVDDISFTVPDPGVESFQYNNANELTRQVVDGFIQSFVYDDWGRMVTKTRGGYQAVYKYRFGDKLKQINTNFPGESAAQVEYSYDGMGRRRVMVLGGTTMQWQRYDLGWNVLGEYAQGGGGTWDIGARTNAYTWMGMTPLSETPGTNPSSGVSQYYLHDHLGSTRDLFNASKVKTARLDYEPHGQQANQFGLSPGRTFTGKEFDEESGLYHFPYRHYSPDQARWLQRDPLGLVDGPNVYAYVRGGTIGRVDALGLEWIITTTNNGDQGATIFVAYSLPPGKKCCGTLKFKQYARTVYSNPIANLFSNLDEWHLDGGEWYPYQSGNGVRAQMDDTPAVERLWYTRGGSQFFRLEIWCVPERGKPYKIDEMTWEAETDINGNTTITY